MGNTPEGGKKGFRTILKRKGRDHWSKAGKIGGKAKVKKGFAVTGDAKEQGILGAKVRWVDNIRKRERLPKFMEDEIKELADE